MSNFPLRRYASIRYGYQVRETDVCSCDPGPWEFQRVLFFKILISVKLPVYSNKAELFTIRLEVLSWVCCNPESDVYAPSSSGVISTAILPSACCSNHRAICYFLNSPCTFTSLGFCFFLLWNVLFIPFFVLLIDSIYSPKCQLKCYFPCFSNQTNGSLSSHTSWYFTFAGISMSTCVSISLKCKFPDGRDHRSHPFPLQHPSEKQQLSIKCSKRNHMRKSTYSFYYNKNGIVPSLIIYLSHQN